MEDTGPGIPADCRESIFQPFFRVDKSRSREMGGVGLGLALVREIAVLHGGSVTVESSSENGTTFVVTRWIMTRFCPCIKTATKMPAILPLSL